MKPTPEQIERLPKWAQAHIEQLDRQRRDAITALARFQDSDEPTMISYQRNEHLDGDLQTLTRYLNTHQVQFTRDGVTLTVTLPYYDDNEHGIKLSWGPEGSHGLGDMCFTPTSYQQARITNMVYQPREYRSLMDRKEYCEKQKNPKVT